VRKEHRDIKCLRCNNELVQAGIYRFHEGKRYGVMGNIGELFVNQVSLELYECSECGKIEFYSARQPNRSAEGLKERGSRRAYCMRCGRLMTAENGMYGTNVDGSKNVDYCVSCI